MTGRISLTLAAALMLTGSAVAQELGKVDFPTSTSSADAQEHFLRGVLLLHSFTFEAAEKTFQDARRADPDFVMTY